MTVSVTLDHPEIPVLEDHIQDFGPDLLARTGHIAFDSSYPTGGEPCDLEAILGVDEVVFAQIGPFGGYFFAYVYTATAANRKVLVYMGDNNNASDAPLVEANNTRNLSGLTAVPFKVYARTALPSEL